MKSVANQPISFEVQPFEVNTRMILLLPKEKSAELPSRGMCFVKGKVNGVNFEAPLEPDGTWIHHSKGSHWLEISKTLQKTAGVKAGVNTKLEITPIPNQDWPEPDVPADLAKALSENPEAKEIWDATTPAARWDWIRSVRSTNSAETRKRRIETAMSKLASGKPRQCCFNRSTCTVPEVSRNGALLTSS